MKKTYLLIIAAFISLNTAAQLSTKERPVSFGLNKKVVSLPIDTKTMPLLDMESIKKEDAEDEEYDYPPRFGFSHKVNFNLNNSGTWTILPDGARIWRLMIVCPNALSINLLYDKFWLPDEGKFFIYTSNKDHCLGAFTNINNKGDRNNLQGFATGLLYGDTITLEYYQSSKVKDNAIISIAYVVHGYRYINFNKKTLGALNNSGSCQINVNCSEGDDWQDEKRAVALIIVDGNRYCTGSLVRSSGNDYSPLLLTANHCLGGLANINYSGTTDPNFQYNAVSNPILNHWTFWWNYEDPGCNNSCATDFAITSGATILANNSNSDFALLQLTEDPKFTIIPYYLGWDRSGSSGTGGVGIHHPSGDVKMISTYAMSPTSNDAFWEVNWSSTMNGHGTTEGGSSGSPLINNSHRIIGQLQGGKSSCSNLTAPDYYGKFSVSWTGDGTNTGSLHNWLDPYNIGMTTADGSYPTRIAGASLIASSQYYTISNLPSGYLVEWSLSDSYYNQHCLQQDYPSQNQCTITRDTYRNMMNATLTATIKYNGTTIQTLTKTGLYAYNDFYGSYTSEDISGTIDYTHVFYVRPGYSTVITSPNLIGATVSYDNIGTTPLYLNLDALWKLYFTMPTNNGGVPVILNVNDVCGNHYQLYAMPQNSYYLNISYGEGNVTISLVDDAVDSENSELRKNTGIVRTSMLDQPWSFEIRSATKGDLKTAETVNGRSATISTASWPKGIYVIKAILGKDEVIEKIIVK